MSTSSEQKHLPCQAGLLSLSTQAFQAMDGVARKQGIG